MQPVRKNKFQIISANLNQDKKYKIAYYKNAVERKGVDAEVRQATLDAIELLKSKGHEVDAIEFAELDYIVPAYYVLTTAEASSNLSRFDGVKYGYHAKEAKDLEQTYKLTRSQGFGKEVQRRIMSGTFVLSAGYYDAYYSKAQKVRRIVADKTKQTLEDYDFIVCPTAPTAAYKIGEVQDSIASFLGDILLCRLILLAFQEFLCLYTKRKQACQSAYNLWLADGRRKTIELGEFLDVVIQKSLKKA